MKQAPNYQVFTQTNFIWAVGKQPAVTGNILSNFLLNVIDFLENLKGRCANDKAKYCGQQWELIPRCASLY